MRDLDNHMLSPLPGELLPDDRDGCYYCCECGARIRPEDVDPLDDYDELYCAACAAGDEDE